MGFSEGLRSNYVFQSKFVFQEAELKTLKAWRVAQVGPEVHEVGRGHCFQNVDLFNAELEDHDHSGKPLVNLQHFSLVHNHAYISWAPSTLLAHRQKSSHLDFLTPKKNVSDWVDLVDHLFEP